MLAEPIWGSWKVITRPARAAAFVPDIPLTVQTSTLEPETVGVSVPESGAFVPYLSPRRSSPGAMVPVVPGSGPRAMIMKASSTSRWPAAGAVKPFASAAAFANARAVARAREATTRYVVPSMRNSVSMLSTTSRSTPRRERSGDWTQAEGRLEEFMVGSTAMVPRALRVVRRARHPRDLLPLDAPLRLDARRDLRLAQQHLRQGGYGQCGLRA